MLDLERALAVFRELEACLEDVAEQIHLAGSARRGARRVSDLDVVVVPKGESSRALLSRLTADAAAPWRLLNEGPVRPGKTRQVKLSWRAEALKVEVWLATPDTVGAVLLIRTGPADFSKALVSYARRCGYAFRDGMLVNPSDGGQLAPAPSEQAVLRRLELEACLDPAHRVPEAVRAVEKRRGHAGDLLPR